MGVECCTGFAFGLPNASNIGGLLRRGRGRRLDGDVRVLPDGLEFESDIGGGVQIIFSLPKSEKDWQKLFTEKWMLDLSGIVVAVGGGGEASVAVSSGDTWTY